jgi:hypothetical protein
MLIKKYIICFLFLLCGEILLAQENRMANDPPDSFIYSYQEVAGTFAALYNGKVSLPYTQQSLNHPYFESPNFSKGTLCYNGVVYIDILMRIDLFRDEITVIFPDNPQRIVLDNEKTGYAVLHGATFIVSESGNNTKSILLELIDDGLYPVVRRYRMTFIEEIMSVGALSKSFRTQIQYAVCIEGEYYPVKNKNALLKLFPDRKQELNKYAATQKKKKKKQIGQSIIALVNHYENIK